MLRIIRIATWTLIAALGGIVVLATAGVRLPGMPSGNFSSQLPLAAAIGGPFALPATTGGTVSSDSLKGKPFAVFFGFTYCPDVCPTTLLDLSNTIKQLGIDADRMNFLFVSVDPGRDTIEQLKLYLSSFDQHIIGATGTDAQIAGIARAYRAVYEKVPTKESYTMNHTATTYLMDAKGQFHGTLAYQENADVVLKKLKRLLAGS
jgi:protein SCO1